MGRLRGDYGVLGFGLLRHHFSRSSTPNILNIPLVTADHSKNLEAGFVYMLAPVFSPVRVIKVILFEVAVIDCV